jgi:hypothetical protein
MKFFTPDLYARCQSRDETILDSATEEWEQANERYEQQVQALEARMPPQLHEFTSLLLHDARILALARDGERLFMVLHKDIPPRDVVFLVYHLDGEPILEPFAQSPRDWSRQTDFQFDELDVVEGSDPPAYQQEIVFGNGWLLRLRFRDVQVTLAQALAPNPADIAPVLAELAPAG